MAHAPHHVSPPVSPPGPPDLVAKAARIQSILDTLLPAVPIPLHHSDPFTLLCAVLLSAQTTDKKVNEVTPALFARAPNAAALAQLDEAEICNHIRVIGLAPTKARNLKAMASRLVDVYGGEVPADLDALESLPGVGHKTASVVLMQGFGIPTFPVDTHIQRLAWRWGLSTGTKVEHTERDLMGLFPAETWDRLHLQLIQFGRDHCPALRHTWSTCPICHWAGLPDREAAEHASSHHPTRAPKRRVGKGEG